MYLVAKSYQKMEQVGESFIANGKTYVNVRNSSGRIIKAKVYTEKEYSKYYGEPAPFVTPKPSQKNILGFEKGYISIFKGDTYPHLSWFKQAPECRYSKLWGWYVISTEEVPEDIPEGIEVVKLLWEEVGEGDNLFHEEKVKSAVTMLTEEPSNSVYVGEIGENITIEVTIKKALHFDGYYGTTIMHIMETEEGNVFVWSTSAKELKEEGQYILRGKVKDHKMYKNVAQTILTRCRIIEYLN